jgi:iron(III) transport system substrate-binding protein
MKKIFSIVTFIIAAALPVAALANQTTELLVYAGLEPDQLTPLKSAFEADHPGIRINFYRAPIGAITAKIIAEKSNPRADLVWGLGATSLIELEKQNLLLKHAPPESNYLNKKFKSKNNTWYAHDAFMSAICFNTIEGNKLGIKKPQSVEDLIKPEFKGRLQMPDPNITGTGFIIVAGILDLYGEKKGWDYLVQLDKNVVKYTPSGSTPCVQAASGEFLAGWSNDIRAGRLIAAGAPIEFVVPKEGLFWDFNGAAILSSSKNEKAAKTLHNWIFSKNAMAIYGKDYAVLGRADVESNSKHHPGGSKIVDRLTDIDLDKVSANKEAILSEWNRRFKYKATN